MIGFLSYPILGSRDYFRVTMCRQTEGIKPGESALGSPHKDFQKSSWIIFWKMGNKISNAFLLHRDTAEGDAGSENAVEDTAYNENKNVNTEKVESGNEDADEYVEIRLSWLANSIVYFLGCQIEPKLINFQN